MVEEVTQSQKGPMPRRPGEQRWGGGGGPAAALWEAEPAAGPATTGRLSEASLSMWIPMVQSQDFKKD